ncbi:hypothetical protein [Microbacterium sp. KRD174]
MRYSEFVQAVRHYPPSNLLPFLAAYSAEREHASTVADAGQWLPWAVTAIAKESALRGNEHRHGRIDGSGVTRLVQQLMQSDYIDADQSVASMLTPIMYEQFPYQESPFEEMARTHALLVRTDPGQDRIPWEEEFGIGLDAAMRASHVLHTWVVFNQGRYDPDILDMPHFQDVFDKAAPRSEIEATAKALTADTTALRDARSRADEKARVPLERERYGFNPLRARPLIELGAHGTWAPQTMLVPRALLGSNLYYRGLDRWGKAFADSLGPRTQHYVGRHLGLLGEDRIHPEIEYAKAQYSIDWIWVSDAAVILVECKAARLGLDAQAGGASLGESIERYIGAARRQIDRTAALLHDDHPAFAHIPKDRPIVGVVTTAEPFYLADTPFSGFTSTGVVPSMTLSLRDLEALVTLPEPLAAALVVEHAHPDGLGGRFGGAVFDDARERRNPILEEAFHHYDLLAE